MTIKPRSIPLWRAEALDALAWPLAVLLAVPADSSVSLDAYEPPSCQSDYIASAPFVWPATSTRYLQ